MGAAAATLLPGGGLSGQQALPKERLIARSTRPQDLETPASLLDSWITPNDLFYVRSHFYTPSIDETAWTLVIDGEVEKPQTLTLADVRRVPSATVVATLECAGNGRAFFDPPVAGVQWEKGAVGNARWTGVRLRDLLRSAGLKPAAQHLWLDGADTGVGRAPDFVRNLPLEKALDPDTLLAYEMNGQMLPVPHGFPLRAIVPGWEGAYSVKWLTHIRVSDREHEGAFVQGGYRYPRRPVAPGATVAAAEMEPLKGMVVKSIISSPPLSCDVNCQWPDSREGIRMGRGGRNRQRRRVHRWRTHVAPRAARQRSGSLRVAAVRVRVATGGAGLVRRDVAGAGHARPYAAGCSRLESVGLSLECDRSGAHRRTSGAGGRGQPGGSRGDCHGATDA